ncbi:hypothetical protein GS928_24890 [Rhodococcus hoagii]|nr:hypothetical protein [Prescottella equi]
MTFSTRYPPSTGSSVARGRPREWQRAHSTHATAYLEVVSPRGESTAAHLVAPPDYTPNLPQFDDGAAADRAHDAAVDQQNGVL